DNPEAELAEIEEEEEETEFESDYDDEEEDEPESPEAGKLYVGNLPYAITSSELSQVFGECGVVNSVEVTEFRYSHCAGVFVSAYMWAYELI
ncbi:33 kDa ribonucleoprotein, chloroplastic, partial [Tanacetum coccineum]